MEQRSERQRWMAVLARASGAELQACWDALTSKPDCKVLRQPEPGLVMVRGRAGGDGQRFNIGEMTVTRCAVRCQDGGVETIGHAYVKGRDKEQCALAARFDALLQFDHRRKNLLAEVIEPLAKQQQKRRDSIARKAAATKVDFFTMVRGGG